MSNADREGAVKLDHKIECPFCGGLRLTRVEDGNDLSWTKCNDCGALGPVQHPGGDRITWTTRSIPTPPPAAEAGEREAFNAGVEAAVALVEERGSYGDEVLAQRIGELRKF